MAEPLGQNWLNMMLQQYRNAGTEITPEMMALFQARAAGQSTEPFFPTAAAPGTPPALRTGPAFNPAAPVDPRPSTLPRMRPPVIDDPLAFQTGGGEPVPWHPAGTNGTPFLNYGAPNTTVPAGTQGTPFLNYGVPKTGAPAPSPVAPAQPPTPAPPTVTTAPPTHAPAPAGISFNPANPGNYGLENLNPLDPSGIPAINIPAPPEINPNFNTNTTDWWQALTNSTAGEIGGAYNYQLPTAEAAQMNTGAIPQPTAAQFSGTPQVTAHQTALTPDFNWMLSGEGYDPATLAALRSKAMEDVSHSGLSEMAQTKRGLEQAGLTSSPAGAAVLGDVGRRTGMATSSALRDISIENAQRGLENKRLGLGYQTQIGMANTNAQNQVGEFNAGLTQSTGLSNMQAANAMALENANRLFSGMSQNLANTQATNLTQFGAEAQRMGTQAGAKAGFAGAQGQQLGGAMLNKAANAETQNSANTMTWETEQARLERQRQAMNQNAIEGRWHAAATGLPSWTPIPGTGYQPQQGFNPFAG